VRKREGEALGVVISWSRQIYSILPTMYISAWFKITIVAMAGA
jgi:hypothetical protein